MYNFLCLYDIIYMYLFSELCVIGQSIDGPIPGEDNLISSQYFLVVLGFI